MVSVSASPTVRTLRIAGLVAAGAALTCVVGDLSLQYTANRADLLAPDYRYFVGIPEWRLLLGHYLGVLALPLQLAGMWLMYQALLPAGRRLALAIGVGGAYAVAAGPGLHSTSALLALVVQARASASPSMQAVLTGILQRSGPFVNPLGAVILTTMVMTYLGYALVVGFRPTRLPRWMALCNPLTFLLAGGLLSLAIPRVALVVVPAGLNLTHLCFYVLVSVLLWNADRAASLPLYVSTGEGQEKAEDFDPHPVVNSDSARQRERDEP